VHTANLSDAAIQGQMTKTILTLCAALTFAALSTGCKKKPETLGEKIEDKVKDATDSRPNEKVKDAAEDVRDGVKDAARDVKDAVKENKP
jgi:hypothetical protein